MESVKISDSESLHAPTKPKRTPWEICLDYARGNAKGEVEVWKEEMSNLLIFASLFSGVAGAFSVESYHNIKQDPAETTVVLLKSLLALQLNATSPQPQTNIPIDINPIIPITASARRISIYNFLSLILSLSVVMAGILCLQWLREYDQDPSGIPRPRREHLGIRYMRNEGMKKWGVFRVLKILPLILLLSLFLFFAGIIELLLDVDQTAAIVSSVAIGISATFMVVTTVFPTVLSFRIRRMGDRHRFSQCPWKSPQAWIFYRTIGEFIHFLVSAISTLRGRPAPKETNDFFKLRDWSAYDWLVYKGSDVANVGFGIHWLGELYFQEKYLAKALYQCIQDKSVHQPLQEILELNDNRRAQSFHRDWPSSLSEDTDKAKQALASHRANLIVFQTLSHLAEKIERGHPPTVLLEQRLDMFFGINRVYADKDIDCPLVGDMDQRLLDLPETRQQLLQCIFGLMKDGNVGINGSHLAAFGDIFDLEANADHPDLSLFDDALTALDGWINNLNEQDEGDNKGSPLQDGTSLLREALKQRNHVRLLRGLIASRTGTRMSQSGVSNL